MKRWVVRTSMACDCEYVVLAESAEAAQREWHAGNNETGPDTVPNTLHEYVVEVLPDAGS